MEKRYKEADGVKFFENKGFKVDFLHLDRFDCFLYVANYPQEKETRNAFLKACEDMEEIKTGERGKNAITLHFASPELFSFFSITGDYILITVCYDLKGYEENDRFIRNFYKENS